MPQDRKNPHIAALLGNGVSIAFNPHLALTPINEELRRRLDADNELDESPADVLMDLAETVDNGDDPIADFEALLGPLDQMWSALGILRRYARAIGNRDEETAQNLLGSYEFLRRARRIGVSHALDIIMERSYAAWDERAPLVNFTDALVEGRGLGGRVTIGNLNYDSVVQACLLQSHKEQLCDLSAGHRPMSATALTTNSALHDIRCYRMRETLDFPLGRPVRLLHLHGSLAWVHSPTQDVTVKMDINDMRSSEFFAAWREGKTDLEPRIVLTNQPTKSKTVQQQPFALAYAGFRAGLEEADRWVIAGYSFRDHSVNDVLAGVLRQRESNPPKVLVLTYGDDLQAWQIHQALGLAIIGSHDWIKVDREGVLDAHNRQSWEWWLDGEPLTAVS